MTDNDKLPELSATSAMRNAWRFAEGGNIEHARIWTMIARELREGSHRGCPRPAAHLPSERRSEPWVSADKWEAAREEEAALDMAAAAYRNPDRYTVTAYGVAPDGSREPIVHATFAARSPMLPGDRCGHCGEVLVESSVTPGVGAAGAVPGARAELVHALTRQAVCPSPAQPIAALIALYGGPGETYCDVFPTLLCHPKREQCQTYCVRNGPQGDDPPTAHLPRIED